MRQRTSEVTRALEKEAAVARRLRAAFETELLLQGYLDTEGRLLDANAAALAAIRRRLEEVAGQPFWDTPWFSATEGMRDVIRAAVDEALAGRTVRQPIELALPDGRRRFRFSLRPVLDDRGRVVGLVPEALAVDAA